MANMDIVVRATDNASKVLDKVNTSSDKATSGIKIGWRKAEVAILAFAAGLEVLARKQNALTEKTRNLAASTGIAEGKMRKLILATSDVAFSLEDVQATMTVAREVGLKSGSELKKYANFWDEVARATGGIPQDLAKAGVALNAVGIEAGNEAEALSAFGFVTRETTMTIEDFLGILSKAGPKLAKMGLSINDTAAIIKIFSLHMGGNTRKAVGLLNKAIEESDGNFNNLLKTLGISSQEMTTWTGKVQESSTVIKDQAKNNEKSYTVMQKAEHWASELACKYGDLINTVSQFATILAGLPAVFELVRIAQVIYTALTAGTFIPTMVAAAASVWALTVAFLSNPLTWVIASFLALAAAIWKALEAYQGWREALGQEKEAMADQMEMLEGLYTRKGKKGVLAWWEKTAGSMEGDAALETWVYIQEMFKSGPKPKAMASGGIATSPVLALIGEGMQDEAVLPLPRNWKQTGLAGGGTMKHSGTIRVEGVNDRGELKGVVNVVVDQLRRELRMA